MPITTAELHATFKATQTGSNDFGGPLFLPDIDKMLRFTDGVTADKADILWGDMRTLAASATENLDLAGVLTDAFGVVVAAVKVVAVLISADAANTNDVIIGGHATLAVPLFGGTLGTHAIKPGGVFLAAAPGLAGLFAVTPTTFDMLKVMNSGAGTGVTYSIIILARSA